MAVRMTRTCDYPMSDGECPEDAPNKIELTAAGIVYRVDVCDGHQDDLIDAVREAFNFRPVASWVQGKRRDAHVAASGAVFTTADVREWAIEQGLKVGAAQGRVSTEHVELYAAQH
jgi:hypothetical protein